MQVEVKNIKGESTGRSIELPADIFGIEPNEHAVYLAVKQYLAHQRQGTHKTKERSEASGSTRKLHKQKGTGGSRKGDINSVVLGGSRTFGPKPHDYAVKLNKKVRQLARKSVLSAKAAAGSITVVEDFSFEAPKTKDFVNVLVGLGVKGRKSLVVVPELNEIVLKSSRNVERTGVARAGDLNTYQIMNTQALVLTESAIAKIQETFA